MIGYPVKLMATVLAVFLVVSDFPATSASVSYAGRKSFWLAHNRDGWMKTVPREEGASNGLNISLRGKVLSPPPSPLRNKQSSMRAAAPPPEIQ